MTGKTEKKIRLDISTVVTGGNEKFIIPCLDSIYQTVKTPANIFVTCNAVSGDLRKRIREKFPAVVIIENAQKKGFAENHNNVVKQAGAEYALILNDDTILLDGTVDRLIAFMDGRHDVAIAGPKVLNPDMSLQQSTFYVPSIFGYFLDVSGMRYFIPFNRITYWLAGLIYSKGWSRFWNHDEVCEVATPGGACVLVRRGAIKKVGLMDEVTRFLGEDTEWHYRFVKSGWKVVFYPDARIIHYGSQSLKSEKTAEVEKTKGMINFFKKHRSDFDYRCLRLMIVFIYSTKLVFYAVAGKTEDKTRCAAIVKIGINPEKIFPGHTAS